MNRRLDLQIVFGIRQDCSFTSTLYVSAFPAHPATNAACAAQLIHQLTRSSATAAQTILSFCSQPFMRRRCFVLHSPRVLQTSVLPSAVCISGLSGFASFLICVSVGCRACRDTALVLIGFVSWLRFLFVVGCRFWLFCVLAGSGLVVAKR